MDLCTINQLMLDKLSPRIGLRWTIFGLVLFIYALKVLVAGTHHLISYCVGVYLFHGLVLFATPKDESIPDPFEVDEEFEENPQYNIDRADSNLRPFIRNMPEYAFWTHCMSVVLVSFVLTLTKFTDIPVYTPILVFYFIFMALATVIKLWQHSKKYNYSPFFQGKLALKE